MIYEIKHKRNGNFRFGLYLISFLILIDFSGGASASAKDKTAYTNNKYRLTFKYPSSYELKMFGESFFDLISEGKILLRGSIEDVTFKIFIKESKPKADVFKRFARKRCKIVCGADGPDGSSYCNTIESERQYTSSNGLNVFEFYLVLVREDYANNTKHKSSVGPVYMVDISRSNRPLALMIFPGYGNLASASTRQLSLKIIDTILLLP